MKVWGRRGVRRRRAYLPRVPHARSSTHLPVRPESHRLHRIAAAALLALACGRGDAGARDTTRAASPTGVAIAHAASRDLTGDGRPEQVRVTARGPSYEKLDVRLAILDAAGAELYAHAWTTDSYFKYTEPAQRSAAADRRKVETQLARLVADTAFTHRFTVDARGRRSEIDTAAIRYHLAETALAERQGGGAAGRPVLSAVDASKVADTLVTRVADDVRGKPSYTYFAGGEETYTIRWSERLRRFVRVFACC